MTSPRTIVLSLVSAVALLGLTACGASNTASPSPSSGLSVPPLTSAPMSPTTAASPGTSPTPTAAATPALITFPGDGVNISIKNVQNPNIAAGISADFRAFLGKQLHTLWKQGGAISGCQSSALIVLSAYRSDGYASASDEGMFVNATCARGGTAALYAQVNGAWQEIAQSQGGYDCSVLQRYKVPASIAGNTCNDASGNQQPYQG